MGHVSFDIFCQVIDNYGDIGVSWRLAKQLANSNNVSRVRLWVDDLYCFNTIAPAVDPKSTLQTLGKIDIVHWTSDTPSVIPYDCVIEAFACTPPASFVQAMVKQGSLWLNLEYLSAEDWVASCHALPSLQANGLSKYFFFPGFTANTGGLLREPGLLQQRDRWLAKPHLRYQLLQTLGVPELSQRALQQGARQVLLFSYPDAPLAGLIRCLSQNHKPTVMLVPTGVCPNLPKGTQGQLTVHRIPFIDQTIFDTLLWSGELNFVRGEDSFVRALWAGKPMIWQIYAQDQSAHIIKLSAWLKAMQASPSLSRLMQSWNSGDNNTFSHVLDQALSPDGWSFWRTESQRITDNIAALPDLANTIIDFFTQKQRTG